MAGRVLTGFNNGFAGTVSRAVDNVIISGVNGHTAAIAFGTAVGLDNNGKFVPASSTVDFVGIAVRIAKTNETYGADDAAWQVGETMDVITRGTVSVAVKSTATPAKGGAVYIAASGEFDTNSAGTSVSNCVFFGAKDSNNVAELEIKTRNL